MKEADFQRRVTDMATRFGWSWWHVPAPMRRVNKDTWVGAKEGAGIADLILTHDDPPRLVFMELKGDGGKLSDPQQDFLSAAKDVAVVSIDLGTFEIAADPSEGLESFDRTVGVFAFWPKDEPAVEQLLRSRILD